MLHPRDHYDPLETEEPEKDGCPVCGSDYGWSTIKPSIENGRFNYECDNDHQFSEPATQTYGVGLI